VGARKVVANMIKKILSFFLFKKKSEKKIEFVSALNQNKRLRQRLNKPLIHTYR
jgi:hypothetical protein